MFKLPMHTEWMKKQMEHEPTRRYAQEITEVVKEYGYKNAVEIGCAWGVSTLAILMAGDGKLTSVDSNPKTEAPNEVEANGFQDRWRFVGMRSEDFWKGNGDTYDLVYIDGSHLYNDVYIDLNQGWDALEPGGLLMIDDFTHKNNRHYDPAALESIYGVSYACWQLVQERQIRDIRTKPYHILYMRKP